MPPAVMRALLGITAFALAWTLAESGAQAQAAPPAPAPAPAPPVIVPPKLLSDPMVVYPEGGSGEATVVLTLLIGADGSVQSATAAEPNEPFSSRAEAAALTFRFEPALRNGRPVAAKIRMEIAFKPPLPSPGPALEPEPEPAPAPGKPAAPPQEPIEITVQGVRPSPARSATLSRAEVRQLPGAFGDPFRALEVMPGVTPIVSGLPFFFVRGAPPGNVGYYLDGIRVPLLFHVGIGPSVIHPALVDRVDLYPGGYPARFGRFAGGIVSGETTAPGTEFHGEYNLRLFDAGALAEAPFADGRGAALVGGRYSYTATLLSLVAPETTLEYWDYQARVGYDLSSSDRVSVFAFGSYDFLGQKTQAENLTLFGTEFHRADLRYDRKLGASGKLRTALTIGLDRSRAQQERFVRNRMAAARTDIEYRISRHALFRTGTDVQFDSYDIELGPSDLSPAAQRIARFFPSRTDRAWGVYGDLVLEIGGRLELTPGLRIDAFASDGAGAMAFDPRLAVRALVSERVSLLAAYGVAHQPPAFVVPLPGFQPGGLHGGLQRALQESFGVEVALGGATTFTATVFQNSFFDMSDPLGSTAPETDGCPPGSFPDDSLAGDRGMQPLGTPDCGDRFTPGTLGPDRSGGGGQGADSQTGNRAANAFEVRTMGSSRGLELLLKRRLTQKVGGFLSYTLSQSIRSYERRRYTATFDRTHVANAALAYDLGKNWRAGTRLVFYTGLPHADPTDPDDTRLPPFFRLDLRLEKRWWITDEIWIAGVAEWMNATLNTEAVSTTCTLRGCEAETIGPVTIPSLGLEGGF